MSYKWVKKWKVSSNSSVYMHIVALSVDGEWGCGCAAWTLGRKRNGGDCRHIREIKNKIKWKAGDLSNLIELQALRITQLREKGKTEEQIEKDMETLVWE